ncbi:MULTISPECIES: GAF and ANTAR domain-containing protein [unclassified Rhodococcus (in: high G+C Gram-positive bacteria)]|uniref:GAF and ANTAR domain-containing protein n=1 Tax=unclassified Rhodococcus (in: high G+C Gram-positive bacteria) TaxID=192944 RepID=UPI00163B5393|nr:MULTISPECIES: GAF and ANTAR domain-containing protein [unclassified Rhodococcus (in: high G+C Gram-positive bacteria)]MBC2637967.1 GAF and ANTAR domain-containing protein [Rhodococcus sp. 3A]MBC2897286.1 GAF and ANTAR domain-containing protein [Rhodococcus sp. 4CII]
MTETAGEHPGSLSPDVDGATIAAQLGSLATALDEFNRNSGSQMEMSLLLQRVCEQVVDAIAGADLAGISLLRDGHVVTVAGTDDAVRAIDIDAVHAIDGDYFGVAGARKVVKARVDEAARRWPSVADHLGRSGMRSFLSAPLAVDEALAGTLNIYGTGDHGFSELDAVVLLVYTTAIEGLLRSARTVELARNEVTGLTRAMKTRAVIEQAKGIVMALQGVSAEQAFEILVAQSQQEHVKLAEVARRIVDSVTKNPE